MLKELQAITAAGLKARQEQIKLDVPQIVENCLNACISQAKNGHSQATCWHVHEEYRHDVVNELKSKGLTVWIDDSNNIRVSWRQEKRIYMMRGWPGSGKSYKAHQIQTESPGAVIISADKLMVDEMGRYVFDPKRLVECHAKCQIAAYDLMTVDTPNIIVDNTNIRRAEMMMYLFFARTFGYTLIEVVSEAPWRLDAKECAARNVHGVPQEKIEKMMADYEP